MDSGASVDAGIPREQQSTPDLLLSKYDLLPDRHDNFLNKISKESFVVKYGDQPSVWKLLCNTGVLRRYAVVLPFYPEGCDRVIPIPFIIDTGAHGYMHLCKGAASKLREGEVLNDVYDPVNGDMFLLKGKLGRGVKFIDRPTASPLLQLHEESLRGDPRGNLLGIRTIDYFQLMPECDTGCIISHPD